MKSIALIFTVITISLGSAEAPSEMDQGQLRFALNGRQYVTQHAQGILQLKSNKARIFIAVKDVSSRFMLIFTADVEPGMEKKLMHLNTVDSGLSVSLRTEQGVFAVMPEIQMARGGDKIEYIERVPVDTGQLEDDPDAVVDTSSPGIKAEQRVKKPKRKKVRSEYRRAKPRWANMPRSERIKRGEGIVGHKAFRDTFFSLQLTPILSEGKVVAYKGAFAGTGRFAQGPVGGEIRSIQGGRFNIKVENAP
jgi:hypothetical protein